MKAEPSKKREKLEGQKEMFHQVKKLYIFYNYCAKKHVLGLMDEKKF